MHRSEKRYRKLILALALILLIMVPASLVRICLAAGQVSARTFTERTGRSSGIADRKGGILAGGETDFDSVVGNLTGNGYSADNTISRRYAKALRPSGFNALTGEAGLTEGSWKSLETTLLPVQDQLSLKEAFRGKRGCLFSYNYKTGEIYTLLSLPSASFLAPGEEDVRDGRLLNRCLNASYISGSTMKVVTTICALEQDPSLAEHSYDCSGRLETEGGMDVTCLGDREGGHGTHDLVGALGVSCNVYFAQLIRTLNVDQTAQTLRQLGFNVNGVSGNTLRSVGELDKTVSSTSFIDYKANSLWSLIGQGSTQISVIDMAMIAGAAANGGEAALPALTAKEAKGRTKSLYSSQTASLLSNYWSRATEEYYRGGGRGLNSLIDMAKTGTAEQGDGTINRLLLGVSREKQTSFMIVVEDWKEGDPMPADIAGVLMPLLP
ncbi:MAG: hypothetical protein II189_03080 [Lachnospiraceae bacterium]|nr:hypothetical protein [Lachnospiraceae bacterium]